MGGWGASRESEWLDRRKEEKEERTLRRRGLKREAGEEGPVGRSVVREAAGLQTVATADSFFAPSNPSIRTLLLLRLD